MTDDNIKPRDRHLLTRVAEAAQVAADSGRRCALAEILDELGVKGHEFHNARARAKKADAGSPLLGRLADAHATLSVGAKRRKRVKEDGEEAEAAEVPEEGHEPKKRRKRQGATAEVGATEDELAQPNLGLSKWPEIDAVTTAMEGVVHCLSPLERPMQLRVIRAACLLLEIEDEFPAYSGGRKGGGDGEEDGQGRGRGGRSGGGSGRGKQQQRRAGASRRKD